MGQELAATMRHGALRMSYSKRGAPRASHDWHALQRNRGGESKHSGDPGQTISSQPSCLTDFLAKWLRTNSSRPKGVPKITTDASSRGNASPVPQFGFAMVDLDASVCQQFLLHYSVHRGHAIWERAPHVDVIQEREEPSFRAQSSLD